MRAQEGNADAATHMHRNFPEVERRNQYAKFAEPDGNSVIVLFKPPEHDGKFVASKARQKVRRSQATAQPPGRFYQEPVACLVAVRFIHPFEVIKIDIKNCDPLHKLLGSRFHCRKILKKPLPVWQSRKKVRHHLGAKFLL